MCVTRTISTKISNANSLLQEGQRDEGRLLSDTTCTGVSNTPAYQIQWIYVFLERPDTNLTRKFIYFDVQVTVRRVRFL